MSDVDEEGDRNDEPTLAILTVVLKYGAAISLLGTLFALIANILMFQSWGLSFGSIASVSDVFLGGTNVLAEATFKYSTGWSIGLLLYAIASTFKFWFPKIVEFSRSYKYIFSLFCFAILGTSFELFLIVNDVNYDQFIFFFDITFPLISVFAFIQLFDINVNKTTLVIFGLGYFLGSVAVSAAQVAKFGSSGVSAIVGSQYCPTDDNELEWVAWLGSETIVTSCEPPPFTPHHVYLIKPRQGEIFATNPVPPYEKIEEGVKESNNAQTH